MLTQCPNCKKPIVIREPGIHTCPRCEARIWINSHGSDQPDRVLISSEAIKAQKTRERRDPELSELFDAEDGLMTAPWEEREKRGVLKALAVTWKMATISPTLFFTRLKTDGPIKGVALYGWIFLTLGYFFSAFYRLLFLPYLVEATQSGATTGLPAIGEDKLQLFIVGMLVASPLLSIATIYMNALLFHGVLLLIGAAKGGFRATLRVVVYASSPMIFMALPIFGDLFAFIWNMVASVAGLSRVHGVSNTRAMLAVFMPPIALYSLFLLFSKLAAAPG